MRIELEIHEKLISKGTPEMYTSRLCQPIRKQHTLLMKLHYANIPFYTPHLLIAKFLDINDACTCYNI